MAVIAGRKFILRSNQIVKDDKINYKNVAISMNKIDKRFNNYGKTEKDKFKLSNGPGLPLLTNKYGNKIEAFLKLDIHQTKDYVGVNPVKNFNQSITNDRGHRLLKCSEKLSENARVHTDGLVAKIGPYHWQTVREKAAIPHDARDNFYLNRLFGYDSHNRYRESRLPCIPRQRPCTVVERPTICKDTPQHHSQCLTPRKRRAIKIHCHNVDHEQQAETPVGSFQVRRIKPDLNRLGSSDKEDECTLPKPWVNMHGQRPLKCEFTRKRYGQRRNTQKTRLICLSGTNNEMKYKSAESYRRYVEKKHADNKSKHGEGEEINNSSERIESRHSKLMMSSAKGVNILDTSEKEKHDNINDKPDTDDKFPSITKQVIPSSDANISCIGIKSDGVMTPAYGYDTFVLQSVINVNQP